MIRLWRLLKISKGLPPTTRLEWILAKYYKPILPEYEHFTLNASRLNVGRLK